MTKKLSLLIVVLTLTTAAFAGDYFTFGLKAGYTSSLGFDKNWNSQSQHSLNSDNSQGFTLGTMARIGDTFFFEPELLYNYQKQNTKYQFGVLQTNATTYKKSSIDIPLLLGYKLIDVKVFKLSALIGPRVRLDAGTKFSDVNNLKTNIKKASIGLDCGVGFDILNFIVDIRYNLMPSITSFRDVSTDAKINMDPTNAFEVSLAWKLW